MKNNEENVVGSAPMANKMTLPNMKFRIKSPEQSEAIQEKLFALGYSWAGVYSETYTRFTNMPYLYFSQQKGIQSSGGGSICERLFNEDPAGEYVLEGGKFVPIPTGEK